MRAISLVLLFVLCAYPTDYYVSGIGSDEANGLTLETAFLTVTHAAGVVSAGDSVIIAAGTYAEGVTLTTSGTSENRIVFVGNGVAIVRQFYINGADYITLRNLNIGWASNPVVANKNAAVYVEAGSDYFIITGCVIDQEFATGIRGIYLAADHGLITGCTITRINSATAIQLSEFATLNCDGSHDNKATLNHITNTRDADAFRVWGQNDTISYNEFDGNVIVDGVNHSDFVQMFTNDNDCSHSWYIQGILIEGNFVHNTESQVFYFSNVCDTTFDDVTFRNNVFDSIALMGQKGNSMTNIKFYNNVFYKTGYMLNFPDVTGYPGGSLTYSLYAIQLGGDITGEIRNNAFLECGNNPASTTSGGYDAVAGITKSNNYIAGPSYAAKSAAYFTESCPPSINGGNPNLTDVAGNDFTLLSNSFLIDTGYTISSFAFDKNYLARPQGDSWDIGPYEFRLYKHDGYTHKIIDTLFNASENTTNVICRLDVKAKVYLDTASAYDGSWAPIDSMSGVAELIDTLTSAIGTTYLRTRGISQK